MTKNVSVREHCNTSNHRVAIVGIISGAQPGSQNFSNADYDLVRNRLKKLNL